jgi:hypothetical protein
MPPYLRPISLLEFVHFRSYVAWTWVTWLRSGEKSYQKWRVVASATGLCFGTISTFFSGYLFAHATVRGGYPFYHPLELLCIPVGSLTALLGLVAALIGKEKLRLPVAIISTWNLLLWFGDAMAQ